MEIVVYAAARHGKKRNFVVSCARRRRKQVQPAELAKERWSNITWNGFVGAARQADVADAAVAGTGDFHTALSQGKIFLLRLMIMMIMAMMMTIMVTAL